MVQMVGLKEVRDLIGYVGTQAPEVLAKTLNNLAFSTRDYLTGTMPQYIDRPNPFTMRALAVTKADKGKLQSRVYVRPTQASYLVWQIEGGIEYPAKRALVIPWSVKRNRYGNMPSGKVQQLLGTAGVFSATIRGVPGIWQRSQETFQAGGTTNIVGGRVQLMVAYEPKASYSPRWPMLDIGKDWAGLRLNAAAAEALDRVIFKNK